MPVKNAAEIHFQLAVLLDKAYFSCHFVIDAFFRIVRTAEVNEIQRRAPHDEKHLFIIDSLGTFQFIHIADIILYFKLAYAEQSVLFYCRIGKAIIAIRHAALRTYCFLPLLALDGFYLKHPTSPPFSAFAPAIL